MSGLRDLVGYGATPPDPRWPGGARVAVQKFGTFLSGMIMPNIPALIAWGILTALFIPVGPFPNEGLASIVGPTIHYLLPILIAGTGGRMVYDQRGAVVVSISRVKCAKACQGAKTMISATSASTVQISLRRGFTCVSPGAGHGA